MKTLVIIVSYNFECWMDRCLGSLRRLKPLADVLVVDNASQDRTVSLIEELYPEVRLIRSPKNVGFGRANNIGMQIAIREGYDSVFLLNQDAWIEPDTLQTLNRLSEKYPEYGILSPVHLTGSGNRLEHGFACYTGLEDLEELDNERELVPLFFVNAAFWLIPVRVLKQVGGFCPLFSHYGEDVDYVNRLRHRGYRVGYSPCVRGCHDREHRKESWESILYSEEVYLLTEYVNINRPFYAAFGYGVLAGIKKAWNHLLDRSFASCIAYLNITARLLASTGKVLYYRKLNRSRSQQALYLDDRFIHDKPAINMFSNQS